MSLRLIAQNLHVGSARVAEAVRGRDHSFLQDLAQRLESLPLDGVDVGAAGGTEAEESDRLAWMLACVAPHCSREIFLDSSDPHVLAGVASRSEVPCSFNSIRELHSLSDKELEVIRSGTGTVILQLAPGGRLPTGRHDRLRAAEQILEAARTRGLEGERLWLDPVCLPWGDDLEAGKGLLEFLEEATGRWPQHRCVVGLSNVSWGHRDRRRLNREWLRCLRDCGLGAVILDAFDAELLAVVHP